jgi:hypothetical protein
MRVSTLFPAAALLAPLAALAAPLERTIDPGSVQVLRESPYFLSHAPSKKRKYLTETLSQKKIRIRLRARGFRDRILFPGTEKVPVV